MTDAHPYICVTIGGLHVTCRQISYVLFVVRNCSKYCMAVHTPPTSAKFFHYSVRNNRSCLFDMIGPA